MSNPEAIENLYKQGYSIREISKLLSISEWQVRKETKGIEKGTKENKSPAQKAATRILPLALRPEGVRGKEMFPIFKEEYGVTRNEDTGYSKLNATREQRDYVKRLVRDMAKQQGKDALFVKDWMVPTDPYGSLDLINKCANSLNEALQEEVDYFLSVYPEAEGWDLRREIIYLALDGVINEPISRRCERNEQTIIALANRLGIDPTLHKNSVDEDKVCE